MQRTFQTLWFLRLGLAATFLWSGVDMIRHPEIWQGFLPEFFAQILPFSVSHYLLSQGIAEVAIGLSFLSGILLRWFSLFAALELLGIVALVGVDAVTFRDLGLLGGVLAIIWTYWAQPHSFIKLSKH
ncbi:MAG: DoxX family membrane protein [Parcubacteria group bacterium]|nr:DoxX family membrane protein [Parcubacteria group bacterium]